MTGKIIISERKPLSLAIRSLLGFVALGFTFATSGCKSSTKFDRTTLPLRALETPSTPDAPFAKAANETQLADSQIEPTAKFEDEGFIRPASTIQPSNTASENATSQPQPDSSVASLITKDASPLGEGTDLQPLIAQALSVHPRIQAARQRVAALNHRVPQVTSLEDPVIGNTFWPIHNQALQTAGGRVGHQFSLSQKVPWPEKLKARGAIAQREAQVAAAEVAKAEREIVEAVRFAYYELWLADRLIEIVKDNQSLVEDLVTIAEARYRTGGSQQDILRAEVEGDKLDDQLIALRRQREQAQADLGTLIRQPLQLEATAIEELKTGDLIPNIELLIAEAEQCNPNLQGLSAQIARDRAKQSLACLQQYPDFQIGLGYSIINDDQDVVSPVANGHDNINFSIGVSLPVWRDRINGGIREASHQRMSTVHLREAETDRLRGQLRRLVAAAYASKEQLELFRDRLIPRTEQTLEIATADYQGKKADFIDLIESYRELLSYQVQVARAEATLASTLAQIERTVGCEVISTEP